MIIRADFHVHSCDDPLDNLPHTVEQIVARAAARGLSCLAITNHHHFWWDAARAEAARRRGVLLIPAIEARIEHADVIILNADTRAESVRTYDDLRRYRTPERCVIAPHPYYPFTHSVHGALERHHELFDAVEISPFYLPWWDGLNARARRVAQRHGLACVCNTDAHNLWQLGWSWTEVEVDEWSIGGVMAALRAGRCTPVCHRMPLTHIFWFWLRGSLRWHMRALRERWAGI